MFLYKNIMKNIMSKRLLLFLRNSEKISRDSLAHNLKKYEAYTLFTHYYTYFLRKCKLYKIVSQSQSLKTLTS